MIYHMRVVTLFLVVALANGFVVRAPRAGGLVVRRAPTTRLGSTSVDGNDNDLIKNVVSYLADDIKESASDFSDALPDLINQVATDISSDISESLIELPDLAEVLADDMKEVAADFSDSFPHLSEVADEIIEAVSDISDSLEEAASDISDSLSELPEKAVNEIAELMSIPFLRRAGAGGRAPNAPDKIENKEMWEASPADASEARLIVLQITDVYTLDYFAHFKTLLEDTRANSEGCKVVCMLTGDFLSPYLLSCVDRGNGMMHALSRVPMDYLTWGNHEADIDHFSVCRHVRDFPGKWLNSNMLDHDAMEWQQEYDVIELGSPDGTNQRKVGLCAVLSDDPDLYSQFDEPGAFGGATITDPWEALRKYEKILKEEEQCDMVLPLQHLYIPDDHKTCREFDFEVILSGHDHHRVDEVVEGTRLIKPGMNGVHCTVLEVSWPNGTAEQPKIRSRFVKTGDWQADPVLAEECDRAYDALAPLRNTELAQVPSTLEPLSSADSRGSVCSMGKYICSEIKKSMNVSRSRQRRHKVDAVLLMGGNIRGNADYQAGSFFSLEALEAEIKSDEVVAVVAMPGWLLAKGVQETHAGDPIPGWMQHDDGIQEDYYTRDKPVVTHVAGKPVDPEKIYRVATKISDLTNGQCPSWTKYYKANPYLIPPEGAYVNIHAELMANFARNLWRKLWVAISQELGDTCSLDGCSPEERLEVLDSTGNGIVTVEEIQVALKDMLGYSVDKEETSLARFVHSFADTDGDGKVTKKDFEILCDEMSEETDILPLDSEIMKLEQHIAEAILEQARAAR